MKCFQELGVFIVSKNADCFQIDTMDELAGDDGRHCHHRSGQRHLHATKRNHVHAIIAGALDRLLYYAGVD